MGITSSVGGGFKPTFSSIDQLNSGIGSAADRSSGSYERSPFRTLPNNTGILNTPSSLSSASSSMGGNSFISGTSKINLENHAASKQIAGVG